jgi:hypothetical protein
MSPNKYPDKSRWQRVNKGDKPGNELKSFGTNQKKKGEHSYEYEHDCVVTESDFQTEAEIIQAIERKIVDTN